jgi:hypothetical protein
VGIIPRAAESTAADKPEILDPALRDGRGFAVLSPRVALRFTLGYYRLLPTGVAVWILSRKWNDTKEF